MFLAIVLKAVNITKTMMNATQQQQKQQQTMVSITVMAKLNARMIILKKEMKK